MDESTNVGRIASDSEQSSISSPSTETNSTSTFCFSSDHELSSVGSESHLSDGMETIPQSIDSFSTTRNNEVPASDSSDCDSISSSFLAEFDNDNEIWNIDLVTSESDHSETESTMVTGTRDEDKAKDMAVGISVFLNFLRLTFRLSERAMSSILLFLCILLQHTCVFIL